MLVRLTVRKPARPRWPSHSASVSPITIAISERGDAEQQLLDEEVPHALVAPQLALVVR